MNRVAVIGIGSPFGADRLGWEVVERLPAAGDDVVFECWDGPLAGLVERFRDLDAAVLVDAALNGGVPGECRTLASDQLEGQGLCWSSHGFGLADAVALGRALNALPAQLSIVAAEVGDPALPAPPEAAVHSAMRAVEAALRRLGTGPVARQASETA